MPHLYNDISKTIVEIEPLSPELSASTWLFAGMNAEGDAVVDEFGRS